MNEKLFWQHGCGEAFDPDLGAEALYDHQEVCNENYRTWELLPEGLAF